MVEKVARALVKATGGDPDWTGYQSGPADDARPLWMRREKEARAAIEAMKEPNLAMRKVCSFEAAEVTWPAMIDAALSSPAPTEEG